MPREPGDFDCRSVRQVLAIRFRDGMWPAAVAITILIPIIAGAANDAAIIAAFGNAQPNHPPGNDRIGRIGSLTHYLNEFGPFIMLAAMGFAGVRWCWLGHLRPRGERRCTCCGYPIGGFDDSAPGARCSECGADAIAQRTPTVRSRLRETFRGVTLPRLAIDLPGVVLVVFTAFASVLITLVVLGVLTID